MLTAVVGAGEAPTVDLDAINVEEDRPLPAGARLRRLRLGEGGRPVIIHCLRLTGHRAALIDQPERTRPAAAALRAALPVDEGALIVNGGYFDGAFQPDGLWRIDGQERVALSPKPALSGIVVIDGAGALRLVPRATDIAAAAQAMQAGPFLIDPGGAVGVRRADAPARRTVLARDDADGLLVIVTGALALADLAVVLHRHGDALAGDAGVPRRIERALNLDGGPSTALYLRRAGEVVALCEPIGAVRTALTLVPR